jgi:fructokinase
MGTPAEALPRIERLIGLADVVKASDEDVAWLEPGRTPAEVAAEWLSRGPALVVITRGGDGAVAAGASAGPLSRPGMAVDVADTVGAGDSFMAALLAGLARRRLLGAQHREALRAMTADDVGTLVDQCIEVSAITCSRPGADPPRVAELTRWT